MKTQHLLFLLFFASLSLNLKCKKENNEPQLPPETQTGAFTFGCKINGKIYTASGKEGFLSNESVYYALRASDSAIFIKIRNSAQKFCLDITIKYNGNLGVYNISSWPYNGTFQDNSNGTIPGSDNLFETSSNFTGKVNIKFFNGGVNPINTGTILSGAFEMDAANANGQQIKVTEGRFDIGQ